MRGSLSSLVAVLALLALSIVPLSAVQAEEYPLHAAVRSGDAVAIREALHAGANVDRLDSRGFSPLLSTVLRGQVQTVVTLLAEGADPNLANTDGATPLMAAAIDGNLEITKLLLVAGADPAARNHSGATAETKAEEYGHAELAEYLSGLTPKTLGAPEPVPSEPTAQPPVPPLAPSPPRVSTPPPPATPSIKEVPAPDPPVQAAPPAPIAVPRMKEPPVREALPAVQAFRARYVVRKGSVLRSAPNRTASVEGSLAPDTEIWVTGKLSDRNWYRIGKDGSELYIYGSVIEPLEAGVSVPSVEAPPAATPAEVQAQELPAVASPPPPTAEPVPSGMAGRWARPEPDGSCTADFLEIEIGAGVLNVWRHARGEQVPIAERATITKNSLSQLEAGTELSQWKLELDPKRSELSYSFSGWQPVSYVRCQ